MLSSINTNTDLRRLSAEKLPQLCAEIRAFLLENISQTGGHLASNLGTVELTVALHRVYDPAVDRILFDVGHQSYTHKILTGRRERFETLRQFGGLSGYPKPCESRCDAFVAGHASDSVSLALGMARGRSLSGESYDVAAVIGDGALTGGLSYEGLCDAAQSGEALVLILNDNGMSINQNVGGMAKFLSAARVKQGYVNFKRRYREVTEHHPKLYGFTHRTKEFVKDVLMPNNVFSELGFEYIGPVDGHDVKELEKSIHWARNLRRPVLLHVLTTKGKGFSYAEKNPSLYHGVSPFNPSEGILDAAAEDFSACFGHALTELAGQDEHICAVTAAMVDGTGLECFAQRYPKRFFDVGIAEGHAVAMSGGLARQGMKPVFAVYNSFLQRAYDMLIEDWALMGLHAVVAVDRSGLVGADGETHHGSFGLAYLSSVPGMRIYAPASFQELRDMLREAVEQEVGPAAICYPRGREGQYGDGWSGEAADILREGSDFTLVTHGISINDALAAADCLRADGISVELIKLNTLRPMGEQVVCRSLQKTGRFMSVEECCRAGSAGMQLLACAAAAGIALRAVRQLDLGSGIVSHGSVSDLRRELGIDAAGIVSAAKEMLHEESKT
ncbi:MAG: 1-deoxy-D-xylulose-5-phosphate synthase [Ruminococcaceae bacterium]|nr:1-deoxy-D-xylulose-5-phosphate synthase [Oscillospiraceae bacterium]